MILNDPPGGTKEQSKKCEYTCKYQRRYKHIRITLIDYFKETLDDFLDFKRFKCENQACFFNQYGDVHQKPAKR